MKDMEKQQLAGGDVTVWLEQGQTVIHHKSGLTIALDRMESRHLQEWLRDQEKKAEDIDGLKEFVMRNEPKRKSLGSNDIYLLDYHIERLQAVYGIQTVVTEDTIYFK